MPCHLSGCGNFPGMLPSEHTRADTEAVRKVAFRGCAGLQSAGGGESFNQRSYRVPRQEIGGAIARFLEVRRKFAP